MAGIHDVRTSRDGGDDESATDALGSGDEVGDDTEVLGSVVRTGAHDARLDLVRNIDDSVVVTPLLESGEVTIRGDDESALALDGLDHETGQIRCAGSLVKPRDGASSRFGTRQLVVQRVRVGRVVHIASKRTKSEVVRHRLEVHRHREVGATVVTVIDDCNSGATGELAGNFDRVLDRFGTRVQQNRLLGEVSRRVLGKQFTQANVGLVASDREKGVREALCLLEGSIDYCIVSVTDGVDTDTASHVDDVVAINVDEDRAFCALDVDGESCTNTGGNCVLSALVKGEGLWSGNFGDDETLLGHIRGYAVHSAIVLRWRPDNN